MPARTQPNFLVVSALVPYKRVDLAIEASRLLRVPLRIVGTGPELGRLRALGGTDVEFLGWKSDEEVRELYRNATAVLMPGVEDFGLVPVEAQACGTPVVALDAGGARETVVDGVTGVLSADRTPEAFADALSLALHSRFDPAAIRQNALRFSRPQFLSRFKAAVDDAVAFRDGEAVQPPERRAFGNAARMPQGGDPALRDAARVPQGDDSAPRDAARVPQGGDPALRENKQ